MYVCHDEHEVGNPGLPKKKGKNSSSCAGEPYGFEPVNDSKMMDERGVEHEAPPASRLLSIRWRIMNMRSPSLKILG